MRWLKTIAVVAMAVLPLRAHAEEPPRAEPTTAAASAEREVSPGAGVPAHGELGFFLGVLFPSRRHDFHAPNQRPQHLSRAAPDLGARAGLVLFERSAIEVEGALAPLATADGQGATGWAIRAHALVGQPLGDWLPFVLVGGGRMGVLSDSLGSDADPAFHWGVGTKRKLSSRSVARLEFRDALALRDGSDHALTHHFEVLLGVGWRIPGALGLLGP
jgi:hypothetical protein